MLNARIVFILLLIFGSFALACRDELSQGPEISPEAVHPDFGVQEAKDFFENNATELKALSFLPAFPATRKLDSVILQLTPRWNKAVSYGNGEVRIIEIPLSSNSLLPVSKRIVAKGRKTVRQMLLSSRKLVVAKRKSGHMDIFMLTLVPDQKYEDHYLKDQSGFRYLGGGDFCGTAFCSLLDGRFVEAYQYQNGRKMGHLHVKARAELARSDSGAFITDYTAFGMGDVKRGPVGSYSFAEYPGEGGSGKCAHGMSVGVCMTCCPHGYSSGKCPVCMDEAVVIRCPSCKQEYCRCCFRCHKYPCECCSVCHDYPCTCPTSVTCGYCFSDPCRCTFCSFCHQRFCYGECQGGGGGGDPLPKPDENGDCPGEECPDCHGIIPGTAPETRANNTCPVCECPVKISLNTSDRKNDVLKEYVLEAKVKPSGTLVSKYIFEIAALEDDQWSLLYEGSGSTFARFSRAPGMWKVRVSVVYQGQVYISQPIGVEERLPSYKDIVGNDAVKKTLDDYWSRTKSFASPNGRKEFGCWIYLDTGTGSYECVDIPNNNVVQGCEGTNASISVRAPDALLRIGPFETCRVQVAVFHTHTPLTYCSGNLVRDPVGPSPGDNDWANNYETLGILYDYLSISGTGIPAGHKLDARAGLYSFGPDRRKLIFN